VARYFVALRGDGDSQAPGDQAQCPRLRSPLLDGCSKTDLDTVESHIQDAINIGAPLYNEGNFDACYHTYDGTAEAIERITEKTCKGPAGVLKTGRERAAKLSTPAAQAWAMRDAFDGLLDVIDRKGPEL
jgi:serine protease Do